MKERESVIFDEPKPYVAKVSTWCTNADVFIWQGTTVTVSSILSTGEGVARYDGYVRLIDMDDFMSLEEWEDEYEILKGGK